MGLGVRPHTHSGPRHRLHMHRSAARVAGQLERPPKKGLFALQFGLYLKGFDVDEDAQPVRKSGLVQEMLMAITASAEAALRPCLDVHRPPGSARSVLILFPPHEILHAAETSNMEQQGMLDGRARTGRLRRLPRSGGGRHQPFGLQEQVRQTVLAASFSSVIVSIVRGSPIFSFST